MNISSEANIANSQTNTAAGGENVLRLRLFPASNPATYSAAHTVAKPAEKPSARPTAYPAAHISTQTVEQYEKQPFTKLAERPARREVRRTARRKAYRESRPRRKDFHAARTDSLRRVAYYETTREARDATTRGRSALCDDKRRTRNRPDSAAGQS